MKIGYARTSTAEQRAGFDAQIRDLLRVGVEDRDIYREQVSGKDRDRAQLQAAIRSLRAGDTFVVTKLDRFARSLGHAIQLEADIAKRGASLVVLDPPLDLSHPTGRLMFGMLSCVAQFERELMLERQREGIAKAKSEGKYRGRAPTAMAQSATVRDMWSQGKGATEIAKLLGMGRASVYRCMKEVA